MNEMIERCTIAAYNKFNENLIESGLEANWDKLPQDFKDRMMNAQKAAIEALREPTDEIIFHPASWIASTGEIVGISNSELVFDMVLEEILKND